MKRSGVFLCALLLGVTMISSRSGAVEKSEYYGRISDGLLSMPATVVDGNDAICYSGLRKESLPATYRNLRVPAVKNQSSFGTCWAHAATACLEINLLKNNPELSVDSIDLSELEVAYYAFFSAMDPLGGFDGDSYSYRKSSGVLNIGGNYDFFTNVMGDGIGICNESLVPYTNARDVNVSDTSSNVYMSLQRGDPAYDDSVVMMTGYHCFNPLIFTAGKTEPTVNIAAIKAAVYEYGAVTIGMDYKSSYINKSGAYYNPEKYSTSTNHDVVIVGWDDTFSKSKFSQIPSGDGAWIVRNSYGTSSGDKGYFYLSYYDNHIIDCVSYEASYKKDYDNIYQYDGGPYSTYNRDKHYFADIYEVASTQGVEELNMIFVENYISADNVPYKVYVYKDVSTDNPESGTLEYSNDFYTETKGQEGKYITLDSPIVLYPGERFSVVVKYEGDATILSDWDGDISGVSMNKTLCTTPHNKTVSFEKSGTSWNACNSNIHLKAYTKKATGGKKPEAIVLGDKEISIFEGDRYALKASVLTDDCEKLLRWKSSNNSVASVSSDGVITAGVAGSAVITVFGYYDKDVFATCKVTVKKSPFGKITYYMEDCVNPPDQPAVYEIGKTTKLKPATATRPGYVFDAFYSEPMQINRITEIGPKSTGTVKVYGFTRKVSMLSVSNIVKGVEIKWEKPNVAEKIYIYRKKAGSSSYKKISTLTGNKTAHYVDTTAVNGVKYTYVVKFSKGSEKVTAAKPLTIMRLVKPKISKVRNNNSRSVSVSFAGNTKCTGYQVRYSTSKTYTAASTKYVTVKKGKVSFTIKKLKKNKTYYISMRGYYKKGSVKYYSVWSKTHKIKITK